MLITKLCRIFIVFLSFSLFSVALAQETPEERLLTDPYLASLGFKFAQASQKFSVRNGDTERVKFWRKAANGRDSIAELKYRFYRGCHINALTQLRACKKARPLMISFPGLGGGLKEAPLMVYAEVLAEKYKTHTLALPSVGASGFIQRVSADGYAGYLPRDIKSLYPAAVAAIADLKSKAYEFTEIYVMGYSMGALQAAHLAMLDKELGEIGIRGVILLNSPMDLLHGLATLDSAYELIIQAETFEKRLRLQRAVERQSFHLSFKVADGHFKTPVEALLEAARMFPRRAVKYAVGMFYHQSLLELRRGAIPFGAPEPVFNELIPSNFLTVTDETYTSYFSDILLPYLHKVEGSELTIKDANQKSSFSAVEEYLSQSNTYMIHNSDDFLLRSGDVEKLKSVFADRLSLFPLGGHLGNIGSPEYMSAVFKSYERARANP